MKKEELKQLVGKKVRITLFDKDIIEGKLNYADDFSAKHDYRKPDYFYIENLNWAFRFSHIKKVEVLK